MSRQALTGWILVIAFAAFCGGCHTNPLNFAELSHQPHYHSLACQVNSTQVEPELITPHNYSAPPPSLQNFKELELRDLSLQEAVHIGLSNSQVIRQLPHPNPPAFGGAAVASPPETASRTPGLLRSALDPAIQDTTLVGPALGIEAALSAFDSSPSQSRRVSRILALVHLATMGTDRAIQNGCNRTP